MKNNEIISTPLIFQKVEPSDWNKWWKIWFGKAKLLGKTVANHNSGSALWKGFDIYLDTDISSDEITGYKADFVNCEDIFKDVFNNLHLLPIDVKVIRAVSSLSQVIAHTDWKKEELSVRTLLYDNNIYNNFYYKLSDGTKIYQKLPNDTNTWGYWDNRSKHGSDYYHGHSKILLLYFGPTKPDINLDESIEKYQNYVIYDNL